MNISIGISTRIDKSVSTKAYQEIVTTTTFESGLGSWVAERGDISIDNDRMKVNAGGTTYPRCYEAGMPIDENTEYLFTIETELGNGDLMRVVSDSGGLTPGLSNLGTGTYQGFHTTPAGTSFLRFQVDSDDGVGYGFFNKISIKKKL